MPFPLAIPVYTQGRRRFQWRHAKNLGAARGNEPIACAARGCCSNGLQCDCCSCSPDHFGAAAPWRRTCGRKHHNPDVQHPSRALALAPASTNTLLEIGARRLRVRTNFGQSTLTPMPRYGHIMNTAVFSQVAERVNSGLDPSEVAATVVTAIREDAISVFTHPECARLWRRRWISGCFVAGGPRRRFAANP